MSLGHDALGLSARRPSGGSQHFSMSAKGFSR
jgi:hypothetical protein